MLLMLLLWVLVGIAGLVERVYKGELDQPGGSDANVDMRLRRDDGAVSFGLRRWEGEYIDGSMQQMGQQSTSDIETIFLWDMGIGFSGTNQIKQSGNGMWMGGGAKLIQKGINKMQSCSHFCRGVWTVCARSGRGMVQSETKSGCAKGVS